MTGRELVERHACAFNHGSAPVGPCAGLEEIRRAYLAQPPDDELRFLGGQANDEHTAVAAFAWTSAA